VEPPAVRVIAKLFERSLLRTADTVVAINRALAEYAVDLGAPPDRVTVIPTGADTARYGPHVDGTRVRHTYGVGPTDHLMLFMGWLYDFSGLRELAQAMAANPDAYPGLKLMAVGSGDLLEELSNMRDTLLGDRLILPGPQPFHALPEFLAAADSFLLPAHANSTMKHIVPTKIYEYLAAGKPIIATPLEGLRREFGETSGIVYASGQVHVLDTAIRLAADRELYVCRSIEARKAATASGNWQDVTDRFESVLYSLASRQPEVALAG
jgi:glycosyltransferase involved in cell wall biosynthesis